MRPEGGGRGAHASIPLERIGDFRYVSGGSNVLWAVMVVIIVAALSGVLGGGGLVARTTVADAAVDQVRYARFARYASHSRCTSISPHRSGRPIRLRVSDRYLSEMNVRAITPLPTSTAIADRQHVFVFERSAAAAGSPFDRVSSTAIGRHLGWIAVDGGDAHFYAAYLSQDYRWNSVGVLAIIGLMIVAAIGGQVLAAQITTFDFVSLLIIGEATQNALLGQDFSATNATPAIITSLRRISGFHC